MIDPHLFSFSVKLAKLECCPQCGHKIERCSNSLIKHDYLATHLESCPTDRSVALRVSLALDGKSLNEWGSMAELL